LKAKELEHQPARLPLGWLDHSTPIGHMVDGKLTNTIHKQSPPKWEFILNIILYNLNRLNYQKLTGLLVIIGLVLRAVIGIMGLFQATVNPIIAFSFEGITLSIIAILITINYSDLNLYHIDKLSIILIIIGTLLRSGYKGEVDWISLLVFWGIAIWLILLYTKIRSPFKITSVIWLIIGLIVGLLLVFILRIPFIRTFHLSAPVDQLFPVILFDFNYHLFHSAILEEPLFRGFLWGYLSQKGLGEIKILFIQAILFWAVHINYLSKPYVFYIVLPIAGIVFGIMAWKSGSLASVIGAHGIYNDILGILY
jgi:membrane protease YdiL (CAAX protease family)